MADTGRGMTWAHLSKPDVSSFPEHLYLMSLVDPGGTGAAGWHWGVLGFSRTLGNELTLKFRESRKRFNSSNTNLDKPTKSGTLH